jgi:hypothetical protein
MATIRPLAEGDIPAVARLFSRVYPGAHWVSHSECEAYFHQIFFANPWFDPQLPSWVAHEGSRIVGFIGVLARPMRYRGRPLRAAVVSQLMVDQERPHGTAAALLLRKALAGPQALTISDGANDASRRMWEALGGLNSALYSLQWRRLLRPAQYALERIAGRARAAALLAKPIAVIADAYGAQRRTLRRPVALREEPLDAAALLDGLRGAAACVAVAPEYDCASLEWILAQARAKRRHGELQSALLRAAGGEIGGWFLYYLNGGTSRVLQVHAREGSEHAVLDHLFHHAWARGAAALEGRMEPRLARALGERHSLFLSTSVYALLHARDPEVLAALARGDAFFSRLEGEWWMRFIGEPVPVPAGVSALYHLVWRTRLAALRARHQPVLP